jgi:hypothetical protein
VSYRRLPVTLKLIRMRGAGNELRRTQRDAKGKMKPWMHKDRQMRGKTRISRIATNGKRQKMGAIKWEGKIIKG